MQSHSKDSQNMVTLDNKTNLAQREQYYAAVHKGVGSPIHDLQCEPIPGILIVLFFNNYSKRR